MAKGVDSAEAGERAYGCSVIMVTRIFKPEALQSKDIIEILYSLLQDGPESFYPHRQATCFQPPTE
jgi:hypothetical protein